MIQLVQYPKSENFPSVSPFCLKLETYLKATETPYENKVTVSTAKTKKKKLPVIKDGNELIEDSTFIIEHLQKKHKIDLDQNLTDEQKSITQAFKWLIERNIVNIVMWFRWADEKNWPKFRDIIFAGAPWIIKATIANQMAKKVKKTIWDMGIGRFTDTERLHLLNQDLKAISDYLGNKKYFFGDTFHSIDCILYAALVQIEKSNYTPQLNPVMDQYPNLKKYVATVSEKYWPEYL